MNYETPVVIFEHQHAPDVTWRLRKHIKMNPTLLMMQQKNEAQKHDGLGKNLGVVWKANDE